MNSLCARRPSAASPSTGAAIRCRRTRWNCVAPPTRCCWAPSADPSGPRRGRQVRPEQGLLRLRQELGVYANLRPVSVHPALREVATLKSPGARGCRSDFRARADRRHLFRRQDPQRYGRERPVQLFGRGDRTRGARRGAAARRPGAASSPRSTSPTYWRPRGCGARSPNASSPRSSRKSSSNTCWWIRPPCT